MSETMQTVVPRRNVRTTPWHGRKGQPIEVPAAVAELWLQSGAAEQPAAAKPKPKGGSR